MDRAPGSAFVNQVAGLRATEGGASAHLTGTPRCPVGPRGSPPLWGHQTRNFPPVPGDDDFLASLHLVEQSAERVLSLEGLYFLHDRAPLLS